MQDYEPKHLKLWTMPRNYCGAIWPDYYSSGFGRSRNSDCLEESNFAVALRELGGESETVIVVREGHFLVGWVEWIAIHATDDKALEIADNLQERAQNYPVLSDDDFSEREYEVASQTWYNMNVEDRLTAIARYGAKSSCAFLQARHSDLSMIEDPTGSLQDYLCRP